MIRLQPFPQRQDVGAWTLLALNCSSGFRKCKFSPCQKHCFSCFYLALFSQGSVESRSVSASCVCSAFGQVAKLVSVELWKWVWTPLGHLSRGYALRARAHFAQVLNSTSWEWCCDLEVSSLNYSTLILLFSFLLNDVNENKVVEAALISFVDFILKILEFSAFMCWFYDVSFKTVFCIWESDKSHLRFHNIKWGIIQYWKYVKWNGERHQHNTIMTH